MITEHDDQEHGLGRIYIPDERDYNYPMSAVLPQTQTSVRKMEWFSDGWWGNQGVYPHCVAFSWTHWINDGPTPFSLFASRRPGLDTTKLYCTAQDHDAWPGNCSDHRYDGTSVRAGAKVLKDWGFISEYRWATTINDVTTALLTVGPVVVGTNWYADMSNPTTEGVVKPTGASQGGHAYLLNGIDLDTGMIRFKNSWGRRWGVNGYGYVSIADFQTLLSRYGEACVALR